MSEIEGLKAELAYWQRVIGDRMGADDRRFSDMVRDLKDVLSGAPARLWPKVFNVKRAHNTWNGEIAFAREPTDDELKAIEIHLRDDHRPAPTAAEFDGPTLTEEVAALRKVVAESGGLAPGVDERSAAIAAGPSPGRQAEGVTSPCEFDPEGFKKYAAPTTSPEPTKATCPHCDGTGDVHRADGEWLGSCDCASPVARENISPISKYQIELLERAKTRIARSKVQYGDEASYPEDMELMLDLVGQIESLTVALKMDAALSAPVAGADVLARNHGEGGGPRS